MAISTIKYDEYGIPKQAKYRIVALGNLDTHEWTETETYAPVMSLVEVRLMAAMAVRHKRVLKYGYVKQAFFQATIPPNENYGLRSLAGCPITPPNSYWLLKRNLYGSKLSPRHWFYKATKLLSEVVLHPLPNSLVSHQYIWDSTLTTSSIFWKVIK